MQLDSAFSESTEATADAESEARLICWASVFSPRSTWSSSSCSSTVTFSTDLATKVCRATWATGGSASLIWIPLLKGLLEDLLKGGGLPVGVPLLMALDNMVVWGEDFRPDAVAAADDITEGGVVFLAPIAAALDDDDDGGVGLILLWCNK